MTEYAVPKRGYSPLEVAEDGYNSFNSRIVTVEDGVTVRERSFDRRDAEYNDVIIHTIEIAVMTPKGTTVRKLGQQSRGFKLYSGSSPFRQIIDDKVRERRAKRKVINEQEIAEEVSRDTGEKLSRIVTLMNKMRVHGQLSEVHDAKGKRVSRPETSVRRGREVTDYTVGTHPVKSHIFEYVEKRSEATYRDIERYMCHGIDWTNPKSLKRYLREMVRDGNLDIEGNLYKPSHKPAPKEIIAGGGR